MATIEEKQITKLEALVVALQDFVDRLRGQDVKITDELLQRIADFKQRQMCLYCGEPLGKEKVTRGDHAGCYALLQGRMRRGLLTYNDAIKQGWMNPKADPPGRRSKRPDPMRPRPSAPTSPSAKTNGPDVSSEDSGQKSGQEKNAGSPKRSKKRDKPR